VGFVERIIGGVDTVNVVCMTSIITYSVSLKTPAPHASRRPTPMSGGRHASERITNLTERDVILRLSIVQRQAVITNLH
jgi:hypothetical protein